MMTCSLAAFFEHPTAIATRNIPAATKATLRIIPEPPRQSAELFDSDLDTGPARWPESPYPRLSKESPTRLQFPAPVPSCPPNPPRFQCHRSECSPEDRAAHRGRCL